MRSRSAYSVNPPTVIVSRSHSGKVKSFIQEAFGNTTIIPAGGAGESAFLSASVSPNRQDVSSFSPTAVLPLSSGYKVLSLLEMPSHDEKPIDQADVYVHVTLIKKWDICAGAALLSALGKATDSPPLIRTNVFCCDF